MDQKPSSFGPQKTKSNILFNDFQMEQIRNLLCLGHCGPSLLELCIFLQQRIVYFFAKLYIILAFSIINYSFPQANILANVKKIKFILFDGNHSFLQIMHQTATCFFIDWKIIILKLIVLWIMYFKSRKEHFWHVQKMKFIL